MKEKDVHRFVTDFLEEDTFETLLELFDVTPEEAFYFLYTEGFIDEEILRNLKRIG